MAQMLKSHITRSLFFRKPISYIGSTRYFSIDNFNEPTTKPPGDSDDEGENSLPYIFLNKHKNMIKPLAST